MAANELTIKLSVNPDDTNDKTIYYQINENQKEFLINSDGSFGKFQEQLGQIVGNSYYTNPKFLEIFNEYKSKSKHTMLSSFLRQPKTKIEGGKKTKSNRSHNSNKTLKNRK